MRFVIFSLTARCAVGSALTVALSGTALAQADTGTSFQALPSVAVQTPAATVPTLSQAVEAAWQRSAQAQEAAGQTQRAIAERAPAASLWAAPPALELSHRDKRWQSGAGRRETEASVAWPLWLPRQRQARRAAVETNIELAQATAQASRLQLAGLVRDAAWSLAAQQAEVELAQLQLRSLQAIADDVRRRLQAGDLAHADVLAAQAEVLTAQSTLLTAQQRLVASQAHWTTLTGMVQAPKTTERATSSANARAADASGLPFLDVATHPEARLAALIVEHARKRGELLAVTRRDPPELLLRLRQEGTGRGESAQHSMGVGVRIPLGTEGRNQPLQAAALSELEMAQTLQQRTQERLAAEAATAQAALQTAEQQLHTERQRTALLRERASLVEQAFKAGEMPLLELLRALAAANQADANLARQQIALGLAHARLEQAFGILP